MSPFEMKIQYQFKNADLLQRALTHKSYAHEMKEPENHNEKLEFLGDAVIDLVLGEQLYEIFGADNEGALSKKRASLVNEEMLAKLAVQNELPAVLRLGKGEIQTGGSAKPRLLASGWEALIGAIYLDGGYEPVRLLVRREFLPLIQQLDPNMDFAADYKTRVQEMAQKHWKATPVYELVGEEGPSHDRIFTVAVRLKDDEEAARGSGRSKKLAEQQAAKMALENLNLWRGGGKT